MIFNMEIEKAMLGCVILGKTEYIHKLSEDDFSQSCYREIFCAMKNLETAKKVVDVISISDALKDKISNIIEILINITENIPTPENVMQYYKTLKEYSGRRSLEKAAHDILKKVNDFEYDNIAECKADVMKSVDIPVNDFKKRSFKIGDLLRETVQKIEEEYNSEDTSKLMTGFYDLDKLTAGLHPEELTIVAARPGVGKTAFAINLIGNLASKGNKCVLISREMSTTQLVKRLISNYAPIDGQKLRLCKALTDDDFIKLSTATNDMTRWPVIINDELVTVQNIRAYCRELKQKDMLDILTVDYLQLCRSSGKHENRRQEIEEVSRQFKEISMELEIPVIVLSQLSRDGAKAGRAPELHDLRESGSIEQDADNVIFLHIPKDTDETQDSFDIQIIVGKQRNGPTGYIYLKYYRKTFKLYSLDRRR